MNVYICKLHGQYAPRVFNSDCPQCNPTPPAAEADMSQSLAELRDRLAEEHEQAHYLNRDQKLSFKCGWNARDAHLSEQAGSDVPDTVLYQVVNDKWPGAPYPSADYFIRGYRMAEDRDRAQMGLEVYKRNLLVDKCKQLEARLAEKTEIADRHYANSMENAHKLAAAERRIKELEAEASELKQWREENFKPWPQIHTQSEETRARNAELKLELLATKDELGRAHELNGRLQAELLR